jgi:hypothetical protein
MEIDIYETYEMGAEDKRQWRTIAQNLWQRVK